MQLQTKLAGPLVTVWLAITSTGCQIQSADRLQPTPAEVALTRPAAEPRSRYQRDIDYLMSLNDLSKAQQGAKGRQRAERDYEAGWGEFDAYGFRMLLSGPRVEPETGLYFDLTGCVVRCEEEVDAYNLRLRELVKEKGLPANAMWLLQQLWYVERFLKQTPDLIWTEMRPFDGTIGKWVKAGPYQVRWEFVVLIHEPDRKYPHLALAGNSEPVEISVDDNLPPLRVAFWAEPNLLVFRMGRDRKFMFWDVSYSRVVYEYDDERGLMNDRLRELDARLHYEQASTRPSTGS